MGSDSSDSGSEGESRTQKLFDKYPTTVKEIAALLVKLNTWVEALDTTVKRELCSLKAEFQSFKKTLEENQKELIELKTEQQRLGDECGGLQRELRDVRAELTELQQYSRRANLELKGVPESQGESLVDIALILGTKVGATVREADIDVVHRIPTKDKPSNIVIKFTSCSARDNLFEASRKRRLTVADLGFDGTTPVYINEHLCRENKLLLGKAIAAKKRHNWRYAWVSRGKILMRKADNTAVIRIVTEADLEQIA